MGGLSAIPSGATAPTRGSNWTVSARPSSSAAPTRSRPSRCGVARPRPAAEPTSVRAATTSSPPRAPIDASRLPRLIANLQARLTKKCEARYGRSYLVLDGSHDELDAQLPLSDLVNRLIVP